MKTLYACLIATLFTISVYAQTSNLTVFSEAGEQFYLILNGIQQNAEPQTNVHVSEINNGYYKLQVKFKDDQFPPLDKNIVLNPGMETTAMVGQNNKGQYKLKFRGEVAVAQAPKPAPETVIVYHSTPAPVTQTTTTTSTTVVNQTQQGNGMGTSENVNVNMNVGGFGVNMNVNVNESNGNVGTNMSTTETSTYSSSTTTTTTTNMGGMNTNTQMNTTEVVYVDGYSGTIGCPRPMTDAEFNKAVTMVRNESFGDDKMIIAKQVTKNKCLVTEQVKEIAKAFDFEDDKLSYAKFAYDYTYDQDNYYLMNEIFTFSASKEELNSYISGR